MKDKKFSSLAMRKKRKQNASFDNIAKENNKKNPIELDDEMMNFIIAKFHASANPEKARELTLKRIRETMEESINDVLKDPTMNSNSLMLGLMVKSSIASCIKTFKEDLVLSQLSGLQKDNYDKLVDDVATEMLNKYFE